MTGEGSGERVQAELTGVPAPDETSDAVLLVRTREGSSDAYGSLYLRHVAAARVLARQLARDPSEADELVAESFARLLGVLQRGAGPEAAFRPYLLSTMRRLHVDRRVAERRTEPTEDLTRHDPGQAFVDAPADDLERSLVSTAFTSLPERWRLVLWHTEVEGLPPAQVAPLLGISANATAALAVRARAGLRDAYLSAHVSDSTEPGCREVAASLGGYVRGTLSRRERAAVEDHLEGCARCKAAVLELSDTAATMRSVIGPLILGVAVLGYREGLVALGPHAIPTFALLQSGAAAGAAGSSSGGSAGSLAANAANAARPVWQLVGAAGVAGTVVIAVVVAIAFAGGSGRPAADRSTSTPTAATPSATPTSSSTPTPSSSPSSGATAASTATSTATSPPTAQPSSSSPSSSTTPPASPVLAPVVADAVSAVGDLVAGRPGYLSLRVTNPGTAAVTQTVNLDLPAGVAFDPTGQVSAPGFAKTVSDQTVSEPAAYGLASLAAPRAGPCGAEGATVVCQLGQVAAGASTLVVVPVAVDSTATGGAWTGRLAASSGGVQRSTPMGGTLDVAAGGGVNAVFAAEGRYTISGAGSSLMSCQDPSAKPDQACAAVESARTGTKLTNGEWPMYPRNDAGGGWKDSSSAQVAWPDGGTVVRAWLTWSATGVDIGSARRATARGPDGAEVIVEADQVVAADVSGHGGYVAVADVTGSVGASGRGTWTVGNVSLAGSPGRQLYAGWALTVVASSPTAPIRDVTVLSGPHLLANGPDWTGSALGLRGGPASVTLVAWEGDAGNTGDSLSVYGRPLTPEDGHSGDDDAVASYATGALGRDGKPQGLSFGVDVRWFAAPAGATDGGSLALHGKGDSFLLGMLGVTTGDSSPL